MPSLTTEKLSSHINRDLVELDVWFFFMLMMEGNEI